MFRRATALVLVSVALGLGGYAAAAAPTASITNDSPAQALCSPGYVDAIIGGEHKCLHAGEFCSADNESDYERYGFACVDGRLQSHTATTTTTTPTTTATTPTSVSTSTAATTTAPTPTMSVPSAPTTTETAITTGPITGTKPPGPVTKAPGLGHTVRISRRSQTARCTPGVLPDRHCSPGAYYSALSKAVLCSSTFHTGSIRNVPDSEKRQVEVEYGMTPKSYGRTIEIDHIISLEIGGSNDIANLYPEPGSGPANYHIKDKLENKLHKLVCDGSMTLHTAQVGIARNWKTLYKAVFEIAP